MSENQGSAPCEKAQQLLCGMTILLVGSAGLVAISTSLSVIPGVVGFGWLGAFFDYFTKCCR